MGVTFQSDLYPEIGILLEKVTFLPKMDPNLSFIELSGDCLYLFHDDYRIPGEKEPIPVLQRHPKEQEIIFQVQAIFKCHPSMPLRIMEGT